MVALCKIKIDKFLLNTISELEIDNSETFSSLKNLWNLLQIWLTIKHFDRR